MRNFTASDPLPQCVLLNSLSVCPFGGFGRVLGLQREDQITSNKAVREMETRIRELERQLGRKTLEVEILKEALEKSRSKKPTLLAQSLKRDDLP